MADINRIFLLGRLGADPIMRETRSGIKVTTFSIATDHYLKTKNAYETSWHKIVVWGKSGERCHSELKKGLPVFIEGKMKTKSYENKEGEKRYSFEVHADHVRFMHKKVELRPSFAEQEAEIEGQVAQHEELAHQYLAQ